MKRSMVAIVVALSVLCASTLLAADKPSAPSMPPGMGGGMPGGAPGMGGGMGGSMPHSVQLLNEGKKDNLSWTFTAIDKKSEGATHFVLAIAKKADDSNALEGGKVDFSVTGPDKKTQKVTTKPMGQGFGGNVNLAKNGKYQFKVSAVLAGGKTKLAYEFEIDKK